MKPPGSRVSRRKPCGDGSAKAGSCTMSARQADGVAATLRDFGAAANPKNMAVSFTASACGGTYRGSGRKRGTKPVSWKQEVRFVHN